MGSRGATSGRALRSGNTPTTRTASNAQVFDMDATINAVSRKGEGTFIRTDIPIFRRNDEVGGMEIKTEKGYATVVDGMPVFIQKVTGGYQYNLYGMIAGMTPIKTLAEAKNIDKIRERINSLSGGNLALEGVAEVFNAANHEGGITSDEYARLVRRNRRR